VNNRYTRICTNCGLEVDIRIQPMYYITGLDYDFICSECHKKRLDNKPVKRTRIIEIKAY